MKNPSTRPSESRTFRPATPADTGHVAGLLVPLYDKLGGVYGIPLDPRSLYEAVSFIIREGVCLVGPCSCAGGFITPYVWNRSVQVGQILFWNYNRPSGVRVLTAIAVEFQRLGATHLNCSSHFPANRAADLYERFGLRKMEISHTCALAEMKTPFT